MTPRAPAAAWSALGASRRSLVAAIVAAFAVVVGVLQAPRGGLASPGALGRPHVDAHVGCAACHGDRPDAPARSEACVGCHAPHPSTRAAHGALAARGVLGCPDCHAGHGDVQGVSFDASGRASRWLAAVSAASPERGPPRATVPLVSLSACARCHDTARASDPVRACVAAAGAHGIDVCFDEHERPGLPIPAGGVCAGQHGPARYAAWEAARRVVNATPAPRVARAAAPWLWVGSGLGLGGLAFAASAAFQRARRRSDRRPVPAAPSVAPRAVRLPRIDAARCLGCHACVDVCPFDVISVDRHVAVVARPDECCGVATCESVCPNGSLTLATEAEPARHQPRVDPHLESRDRPGLFLAGDLTGVPLIRNAIGQGARVAARVASLLPRAERAAGTPERVDLAVVGAGPAGLAAALRARELGLSCAVLEQWTTAATIRAFPRGKIVHDPPIELPLEGPLWLRESSKEELVAQWTRIVRAHRVDVREQHQVIAIAGARGDFVVTAHTPAGPRSLRAGFVLVASGRRGTPRPLDAEVAPGAAGKVVYTLSDARALAGKRVLVVGLGDSAMEAAIALARQPGTTVTMSYRGDGFHRGRARNIEEVRRLEASGRVRVILRSVVARVDERGASLRVAERDAPERVGADVVLALLGGEAAGGLLAAIGVRFEREA